MTLHSVYTYLLVLVSVFSCVSSPQAQTTLPGDELKNIALGVPYTYVQQPTYKLCTDPDDRVQLTDGIDTEGYFWAQKSTVGWANHRNVIITLDLGSDTAIRGVSLRTAAGTAGVAWPSGIRVFVAGEDQQFRAVADLLALSATNGMPAPQPYSVHRYWTDALKTHGRYVAFVVSNQPFTFIDELQVYAGDPAWLSDGVEGHPIDDIADYVNKSQTWDGIARRLRQDGATVRERAMAEQIPEAVRTDVVAALDAIAGEIKVDYETDYRDFRAVLPLNALHSRIFACQATLWRAEGRKDLSVWQNPLWAPLDHLATPTRDAEPKINVAMMDNEYRAASLNVTNARDEARTLRLDILGLPGGDNPDYITVHEVVWTDTASGVPVASALPEAERDDDGGWRIHVPVGMTRQVWLTFHPQGVEAGEHAGRVVLTEGNSITEVPLTFHRYPFRFPDKPTLHFGGWDYTDGNGHRGINPQNRESVIEHLVEHYVDTPWATSGVIPRGAHDSEGHMTTPPDTTRFDEWIARWPDAANYCIFAAVNDRFHSWNTDAPEFKTAVGEWARFWAEHARSRGIDPERLCILLLDEPHEAAQDQIIIAWAKAIEAAGADLTIWEDPTYNGVSESQELLVEVCDVLCPNRPIFLRANDAYRDFYRAQRDRGTTLEFYSCSGPTTLLDPYAYFRLQAWTCWDEGATASYFWAFGDNAGGSSWNEYVLARNIYTLSFLDDTSIGTAKPMEAAREG
ncbi:MAG: hypothetical protein L3K26_18070, partial [Candidatus Hydrogenedentes bacterium]|nr:hypothetical protein [Candidatus Hydrogenedentota bacterium]